MDRGVGADAGGIAALRELIAEHSEAVEYDLIRLGHRLRDVPRRDFNWRDLFVLVTRAQPDTATFKAFVPDWQHTPEVELLRSTEYHSRWLVWAKTKDAERGRNVPKPYPLPWDPTPEKGDFTSDVMPRDQLDRLIGWA